MQPHLNLHLHPSNILHRSPKAKMPDVRHQLYHTSHHQPRQPCNHNRYLGRFLLILVCSWLVSWCDDCPPLPLLVVGGRTHVLRLGFLGSTNLPNSNTQTGGSPALFAARLAISEIMSQTELLPNAYLELINNNTNSDPGTANWLAFNQIQQHGVIGIIGEYNSGVSIAVAYPSRFYRIPQISYGSTSPDFTSFHSTLYPYFLRMCPSQNLESALMAHVIWSQEWMRVGLIYSTDSPGVAGAQSFQSEATKVGIQIVGSAAFPYSASLADVYFAMNQVKLSGATILLFIGAINDMQSIIKVCTSGANGQPPLGMYGPGYQWIGLHSYMYTTLFTNSTGGIIPENYEFAQGLIGLQNFADVDSVVYQQYAADWANTPPQPDLPSTIPTDPSSMTIPGHFSYDAVYFYAHALHRMESEYGIDMNQATMDERALFLDVLKNVTFAGVTGPISVDQNGDRVAPFDLVNFQGKQVKTIGHITQLGNVTLSKTTPIQYMGGTKAVDHIVRGVYTVDYSVRLGMTVMTIISSIVVLLALFLVYLFRDQVIMKAASPIFVMLMLIGVLLLLASLFPRIYENYLHSVSVCHADLFLTNYGYTLMVGSLLVKTYRVDSIFRMRKFQQRILTNFHLLAGLGILLVAQTALLLGLIYGDPFTITTEPLDPIQDYSYCSSGHQAQLYPPIIMSFRFFCLLIAAVYTFRIRNIPDDFNESKQIGMTVYNLTFLSILLPIIDTAMGRGKSSAIIAYGISIFVIAFVSTSVMLIPKLLLYLSILHGDASNLSGVTTNMSGLTSESPPVTKSRSVNSIPIKLHGPHLGLKGSHRSPPLYEFGPTVELALAERPTRMPSAPHPSFAHDLRHPSPQQIVLPQSNGTATTISTAPMSRAGTASNLERGSISTTVQPSTTVSSKPIQPTMSTTTQPMAPTPIRTNTIALISSSPVASTPNSPVLTARTTPLKSNTPRMHVGKGVSANLLQLLVSHLAQTPDPNQRSPEPTPTDQTHVDHEKPSSQQTNGSNYTSRIFLSTPQHLTPTPTPPSFTRKLSPPDPPSTGIASGTTSRRVSHTDVNVGDRPRLTSSGPSNSSTDPPTTTTEPFHGTRKREIVSTASTSYASDRSNYSPYTPYSTFHLSPAAPARQLNHYHLAPPTERSLNGHHGSTMTTSPTLPSPELHSPSRTTTTTWPSSPTVNDE